MYFKVIVLWALFAVCGSQNDENRCKKGKAVAYCGSNTSVEKQYYYDKIYRNCQEYSYCLEINETENASENRFETKTSCIEHCVKKKPTIVSIMGESPKKTNTSKSRSIDVSKEKKQIPNDGSKSTNASDSQANNVSTTTARPLSHGYQPPQTTTTEAPDPRDSLEYNDIHRQRDGESIPKEKKVCYEPKPYEYCRDDDEITDAWYFNRKENKCEFFITCTGKENNKFPRKVIKNNRFDNRDICEKTCLN